MRMFFLCIFSTFLIWPIHSTVATAGDKPIDLLLSDISFLLMPLTYFLARSSPTKLQLRFVIAPIRSYTFTPSLALIFILYVTTLAGIGFGMSGEMVRIFSAFKLAKPIGFVLVGMVLGSWTDPLEFIDITSCLYGVLVAITMFFTVTSPDFPFGSWGKYIGEFELSGYPNTTMSFYAAMVPLLLASVDSSKLRFSAPVGWGLAGCAALIILGSMSRSSALVLLVGVVIYLASTGRIPLLVATFLSIAVLSIVGFGLFSMVSETEFVSVLVDRVQTRLDRSTESEDPSSGRFEIWSLAIELWAERPVFGFMFESFSHFAAVDTPHQQYLEVLYKCGGVGFLLYMGILVTCLFVTMRLLRLARRFSPAWYRLHAMKAMMISVMVGNLTQPNLTYSLTGNLVFMLFGLICSSRAVISASQPSNPASERMITVKLPPPQRAAA